MVFPVCIAAYIPLVLMEYSSVNPPKRLNRQANNRDKVKCFFIKLIK